RESRLIGSSRRLRIIIVGGYLYATVHLLSLTYARTICFRCVRGEEDTGRKACVRLAYGVRQKCCALWVGADIWCAAAHTHALCVIVVLTTAHCCNAIVAFYSYWLLLSHQFVLLYSATLDGTLLQLLSESSHLLASTAVYVAAVG
ncbi:hypothetical protein Tcan_00490, partial [Toxocara canis]